LILKISSMTLFDVLSLETDKKIVVLGLGRENTQFVAWLLNVAKFNPNQVIIADQSPEAVEQIKTSYEILDVNCFAGEKYLDCLKLNGVEYVFKAPGLWSLKSELNEFRARKGEDRITTGLVFFLQKFRSQAIAITGTKGKSTTSSLIAHFLNQLKNLKTDNVDMNLKSEAYYCGNTTNISPYTFWTDLDQAVDPEKFYVIEMSSFQLQDLGYARFSPKFSAIVNYYIDHQDQHQTPEEYWLSKDNIFRFQSTQDVVVATEQVLTRSPNLPGHPSKIIINQERIVWLNELLTHQLPGEHNQSNVAMAVCLVSSILSAAKNWPEIQHFIKLNQDSINLALSSFKSLPHRIQLVHSLQNKINLNLQGRTLELGLTINFYDDGYATESDANVAAIQTLTSKSNEFLWLQMTGKDKGGEIAGVTQIIERKLLENKIYKIDLTGTVGRRMAENLDLSNPEINLRPGTFRESITEVLSDHNQIQKHFLAWLDGLEEAPLTNLLSQDKIVLNILFSPGGSSFDEFSGSANRADWWVEQVRKI
jgi:UDP-N-acetylmuramoylalanine-D-glutamate ligase